jgi:hypothetical protein
MLGHLQFDLRPSYCLAALLLMIHISAIAILFALSCVYWFIFIVFLFSFAHLSFTLSHFAFRITSRAIIRISPQRDGTWRLVDRKGEEWRGELENDSIRTRYFVLLIFKIIGKRFAVPLILPWDTLDKQNFRRLRVSCIQSTKQI